LASLCFSAVSAPEAVSSPSRVTGAGGHGTAGRRAPHHQMKIPSRNPQNEMN
jgi:hypothetical protein